MHITSTIYQPHVQQDLKEATKFINDTIKQSGMNLQASLTSNNQIQLKNQDGIVVKTLSGEKIAHKMNKVDLYI